MSVNFTKSGLYYSLNEGKTWAELTDATPSINSGEKIIFKGNLVPVTYSGIGTYSTTKNFDVSGNIMSLLYGDDFVGKTDLTSKNYTFSCLFSGCTTVVNAKDLILPATTLAKYCYSEMFRNCTLLTTTPELSTTILAEGCYNGMFKFCNSLTSAPELPATTLAEYCYANMFQGCTSLTSAPELLATTLIGWCYYYMFDGCNKLNYIKMLATDISASSCLTVWVQRVSSTGTFVKSAGVNISTGFSGIPKNWTVQEV